MCGGLIITRLWIYYSLNINNLKKFNILPDFIIFNIFNLFEEMVTRINSLKEILPKYSTYLFDLDGVIVFLY